MLFPKVGEGRIYSYQSLFAVFVMFYSDNIHSKLNLLSLRADVDDPLPQLHFLPLCFANAFLQREEGIKSDGLQPESANLKHYTGA